MIIRDIYGLICQHDIYDNNSIEAKTSAGDSSRSTGVMATFGSSIDRYLMIKLYTGNGKLVRHPIKDNNPSNFSRDQLICCLSGYAASKDDGILKEIFISRLKHGFLCQNRDLLNPAVILQMILGAHIKALYWFYPIGIFWHICEILVQCYVRPNSEQNQIMCQCKQFGTESLFKKMHPDWKQSVKNYWCENDGYWRNQPEVANQIIENF